MTAFLIAVVVGSVAGVAYVALAVRSFLRVRRAVLAGQADDLGTDAVFEAQGDRFALRAGAGVAASVLVLSALTWGSWAWYIPPALAIGSALAVIVAFLVDPEGRR